MDTREWDKELRVINIGAENDRWVAVPGFSPSSVLEFSEHQLFTFIHELLEARTREVIAKTLTSYIAFLKANEPDPRPEKVYSEILKHFGIE